VSDLDGYVENYVAQYGSGDFETVLVAARRRAVLASLRQYRHDHVLEVGCGLEPLFEHLTDFASFTVVEPSQHFVERAETLRGQDDRVVVIRGTMEERADILGKRAYDAIVVSSLLHEVLDPQGLLAAVHRLCGAETVVHLNVPNAGSFHRLLAYESGLLEDVFLPSATDTRFGRHTRFDRAALAAAVTAAGFDIVGTGSYFVKPFTHGQMDQLLRAGIVPREVLAGLERMAEHMPHLAAEIYVELRRSP